MDAPLSTCELVDRDDIDQRYLAGTLPPDAAEAFEEHYFGCERCWALVERGLAIRAASPVQPASAAPAGPPKLGTAAPHRGGWWMGLAAAAVLLLSTALWHPWTGGAPSATDAMRGADATFLLSATVRGDSIVVLWPSVRAASDYRVRVSALNGTTLLEREVPTPAVTFARGALSDTTVDTLYVSILARDALRRSLARSALTPLALVRR